MGCIQQNGYITNRDIPILELQFNKTALLNDIMELVLLLALVQKLKSKIRSYLHLFRLPLCQVLR